jgi:hypothetical protein
VKIEIFKSLQSFVVRPVTIDRFATAAKRRGESAARGSTRGVSRAKDADGGNARDTWAKEIN